MRGEGAGAVVVEGLAAVIQAVGEKTTAKPTRFKGVVGEQHFHRLGCVFGVIVDLLGQGDG